MEERIQVLENQKVEPVRIIITDIDISIGTIMMLILKAAAAFIPIVLALYLLTFFITK